MKVSLLCCLCLTDQEKGCCFDQWPIEQCETAKQSGECGESQIANNCLKTCGWCCDNVDGGKKTSLKIFKHYKLKPSFSIVKDNKAKDRAGMGDKPPP